MAAEDDPRVSGHVRNEHLQATELVDTLRILDAARIDGAFICTFIEPIAPYNEDPRYDLDMSALALVKTYERRQGTTFPDMAWDPIEAFFAVANCYATQVTNEA